MPTLDTFGLRRSRSDPCHRTMMIGEDGLVLGRTVLAKMVEGEGAPPELAIDGAEERILALLGTAYGRPVDPDVIGNIRRASAQLRKGEKTVALIHLAMIGLPKLESDEDFDRLHLADGLPAAGLAPRDLMKMVESDPTALRKAGFNSAEARIVGGNGRISGEWTRDGASSSSSNDNLLQFAKYVRNETLPKDAVVVTRPDGTPILDPSSPTGKLMAPPRSDFRQVYAAGQAIAPYPLSYEIIKGYFAVAHEGSFDFQRDKAKQILYTKYINASNYAVGVYMAGAGFSQDETQKIAGTWASIVSSNYKDREPQKAWIQAGWYDANSGVWKASSDP